MLYCGSIAAIAAAALSITICGAAAFDESKYPDWSGQWSRVPGEGPPRHDPSKPLRKQEAPLKPEYQARYEASMKDQDAGGTGLDLSYACVPVGMPRQMNGISPMEFLFSQNVTHILFEETTRPPRRIYTDGRDRPKNQEPTFVGYSIGKWIDTNGNSRYDTLEVETRNMRGPRAWDTSGMPMADDSEAIIKERLYLDKDNPNILHNEMTTTDNSLTRPWTVVKNYLRRSQNVIWTEDNCAEGNVHITINKEVYFVGGDGLLMPAKKDQPPPDLRHFNYSRK
jgi:hypothetical protein